MKFIIDENLSPDLADMFRSHGLAASHVNEMKATQKQRVVDDQLRRLAIRKGYVIVTKDDDFVKSYVNREVPEKMIFIYGMATKKSLLTRMEEVIPQIEALLKIHDFIEINVKEVKFPFSN